MISRDDSNLKIYQYLQQTKKYKRVIFFTIIFSFENHMATNLYIDIV